MLFERYAFKYRENDNIQNNVFDIQISDDDFIQININNENFNIFTELHEYNFYNAAFEKLILTYTKPTIVYNIPATNRLIYKIRLIYTKTKEGQTIVDLQDWSTIGNLNRHQGLVDFVDIFIIPYDNMAKIATEYKYHSISKQILYGVIHEIFDRYFLRHNIQRDDFEIVMDFSQTDFEEIFNNSRKNKKIVFHMDMVNNGAEIINSGKIEYSIKADTTFDNAFGWLRGIFNDNIQRYSIKCEDMNNKTASIDGYSDDLTTNEWSAPARIEIGTQNNDALYGQLAHFLRI